MTPTLLLVALTCAAGSWLLLARMRLLAGWWARVAGQRTEHDLASLFVFIPARRLVGITLVAAMVGVLLALACSAPTAIAVAAGAICLALPRIVVRRLQARWRERLSRQLPDALALWAGLLRAGQGSTQALQLVAQRQPAPLGDELRLVLSQIRLGVDVESAFSALRERAGIADLRLISTLLGTQRELGGNLAESLLRLADLLRGRLAMEARIQSLTAQGRMQGLVVGLLPVLLLAVLYVMERDAMQVLHTTWQGWLAISVILFLELIGFLMIRRIVRIEV